MIRFAGRVALVVAVLVVGGCAGDGSSASNATGRPAAAVVDNTATVCAQWREAQSPYMLGTAPEAKAFNQVVADRYQGKRTPHADEVQRAFWSGWADVVRPFVSEASSPDLKAALTAQVDELEQKAASREAHLWHQTLAPALQACLKSP